jgi:hypothetical protein
MAAIDPAVADRLAAALSVPPGPIHKPPAALTAAAHDFDTLYGTLLAECAAARIELGQWDLQTVAWTARCGPDYALTIASLIRRAAFWPEPGHDRDGSCCRIPTGDI